MSCQQVPRLTEDPYTFTEPPATTAFISTQVQKLPPIKPLNKVQIPAIKRLNGCNSSPHLNGLSGNHIPIYAKAQLHQRNQNQSHSKQQNLRQQRQNIQKHQALQQRLLQQPQQQLQYLTQQNQFQQRQPEIQQVITQTQQSHVIASLQPLPPPPPPLPLTQTHPQTTNKVIKRFLFPPPAGKTVTCTTTVPPPLYQQQQQQQQPLKVFSGDLATQSHIQNHSIVAVSSIQPTLVQPPSLPPPKYATLQRTTSKQSQSQGSFVDNSMVVIVDGKSERRLSKDSRAKSDNSKLVIVENAAKGGSNNNNSCNSNSSSCSNGGTKKSSTQSNSNTFVHPKTETKTGGSGTKKSTGKSQTTARTKRSYSQSSHHEALQRISSRLSNISSLTIAKTNAEWHAPDSYIFDYAGPSTPRPEQQQQQHQQNIDLSTCIQNFWFKSTSVLLTREQRLDLKKNQLRRQAYQYSQAQQFRNVNLAKRRLIAAYKALKKLKVDQSPATPKKCGIQSCSNDALALTAYCYMHITLNSDQKLFHPCTAKFSDNSQCRVPVFDISHELPLCREHAWKRDNYNRMLQEQKPKKPPRKKPKPSAMTRPPKRNKKKKKPPSKQHVITSVDGFSYGTTIISTTDSIAQHKPLVTMLHSLQQQKQHQKYKQQQQHEILVSTTTQEMFSMCENSSAYESSEDTGVGGLSESELISATDEIPLGDTRLLEEHDLTNVLNQLPEDAFNELFTVQQNDPYEPTQEEQEDLERALEAVDEQVKSLEQMTGSTNFLGDFLDVDDEILDDSNMCTEVKYSPEQTANVRGLVHT